MSHVDLKVLDDTIEWLCRDYESIFKDGSGKMKVSQGQKHTHLGMDLDSSTCGQCTVTMFGYVEEILAAWKVADQSSDIDGFQTVSLKQKTKSSTAPKPE